MSSPLAANFRVAPVHRVLMSVAEMVDHGIKGHLREGRRPGRQPRLDPGDGRVHPDAQTEGLRDGVEAGALLAGLLPAGRALVRPRGVKPFCPVAGADGAREWHEAASVRGAEGAHAGEELDREVEEQPAVRAGSKPIVPCCTSRTGRGVPRVWQGEGSVTYIGGPRRARVRW